MRRPFNLILTLCSCACLLFAKHHIEKTSRENFPRLKLTSAQAGYHGKSLKTYSLGFEVLISDLLWVSLLQNADHTKIEEGKVSWEFAQVDAINTLNPRFQRAFHFGSIYLSVFRQDKIGAQQVMRNWIKRFPRSWQARHLLGTHLYEDVGDMEGASAQFHAAAQLPGAPAYLSALSVRLLSESGRLANALQVALQLAPTLDDPEAKFRLAKRVRSLRFALQQKLWEESLQDFRQSQRREPRTIEDLYPQAQTKMRELASIGAEDLPEEWKEITSERFPFFYDASTRKIASQKSMGELGVDRPGLAEKNAQGAASK